MNISDKVSDNVFFIRQIIVYSATKAYKICNELSKMKLQSMLNNF